ncbi:MAG: hypothetical protein FJX35_11505 [Alphaproteobacteria bacterium]|nr:hypothetical protein [Alphaproteobacteria bacterium]
MTAISRISDRQQMANLVASSARAAGDGAALQAKVASGQAYLKFGELGSRTAGFLRDNGDVEKLRIYIENAEGAERRLTAQNSQIAALADIAASARALFVRALGMATPGSDSYQLNIQSRTMLDQVVSGLNATFEGRYLFAGAASDRAPVAFGRMTRLSVADIVGSSGHLALRVGPAPGVPVEFDVEPDATQADIAGALRNALQGALARGETGIDRVLLTADGHVCVYPHDPGVAPVIAVDDTSTAGPVAIEDLDIRQLPPDGDLADQAYYRGIPGEPAPRALVGDGLALEAEVTAEEPGFAKLIRALRIVETATTVPDLDRAAVEEALSLAGDAITEIAQTAAKVGSRQKSIEGLRTENETAEIYHQDIVDQINSLDMGEAMTTLSAQQLQLQASYMMLARLSSLSLLDFMK